MKQRLLGAAVLIALAIIFLPILLTGPGPKPTSETANLQAPPTPDRRFQERTLSLDLPPSGGEPTGAPIVPAPATNPDPNAIATVDTATAPRPEQEPVVDVPATPSPATTAPLNPEPSPSDAESNAEPAESLPGTAANGTYFVHLGDYGATQNANNLVATLKKLGYPARTESSTFGGKPTLRVRVGPFADRASAEATRLRISQTSVRAPASVVQNASDAKPSPKPAAEAPGAPDAAAAPARAGGWAVQLGAFATIDEAEKLRDKLRAASFPSFVDKVTRDGKSLWRVRVGPQAERGSAEATEARIRDRLKLDGAVVANP